MYMRFVRLKVEEGRFYDFRLFYDNRIIPALHDTPGCLFASLLQPTQDSNECVSLTFWKNQAAADAYENSGLYDDLLDDCDDLLSEVIEWRVRLPREGAEEVRSLQDPEVECLPVRVGGGGCEIGELSTPNLFVRIVSARIELGRFDELRERFDNEVAPALRSTPGCRAVFLVEGAQKKSKALSVTVWESQEDAIRYEMSGAFDDLTAKVSEFFSRVYQWKVSLSPERQESGVQGRDLDVESFNLVTGGGLED